MRDRLIGIVKSSLMIHIGKSCNLAENIVDDLLNENVIVPPCKMGQMVYAFCDVFGAILPYYVEAVHFFGEQFEYMIEADCNKDGELLDGIDFNGEDIGKTVFLSREEAEQALAERKSDNGHP